MKNTQKQARTKRETQNGLEQSRKTKKKKTQETASFDTCFHNNFQIKLKN